MAACPEIPLCDLCHRPSQLEKPSLISGLSRLGLTSRVDVPQTPNSTNHWPRSCLSAANVVLESVPSLVSGSNALMSSTGSQNSNLSTPEWLEWRQQFGPAIQSQICGKFFFGGALKSLKMFVHPPHPKFSVVTLTLWPFSPGSPGRPSKPLSPWNSTGTNGWSFSFYRHALLFQLAFIVRTFTFGPASPGIPRAPSAPLRPLRTSINIMLSFIETTLGQSTQLPILSF